MGRAGQVEQELETVVGVNYSVWLRYVPLCGCGMYLCVAAVGTSVIVRLCGCLVVSLWLCGCLVVWL